jgi:hypothetical protein
MAATGSLPYSLIHCHRSKRSTPLELSINKSKVELSTGTMQIDSRKVTNEFFTNQNKHSKF